MTELKNIEKEMEKVASIISSLYNIRTLYIFHSDKWYETERQILKETSNWCVLKEKMVQIKLSI